MAKKKSKKKKGAVIGSIVWKDEKAGGVPKGHFAWVDGGTVRSKKMKRG